LSHRHHLQIQCRLVKRFLFGFPLPIEGERPSLNDIDLQILFLNLPEQISAEEKFSAKLFKFILKTKTWLA
jgi:hypothetical protein